MSSTLKYFTTYNNMYFVLIQWELINTKKLVTINTTKNYLR